jgi:hypothetical protein
MERKVPLGRGYVAADEEDGAAADWTDLRRRSSDGIVRSLTLRWRDVLGIEGVFEEIAEALGEPWSTKR